MQRAKEAAADVAASAKAGMEKTKATVEEKAEKMTTSAPARKEMDEQKKEERYYGADREKEEKREAARRGGDYTHTAGDRRHAGYSAEGPVRKDFPTGVTRGVLDPDRDRDQDQDREILG